ncbi:MAG: hypothetical protein KatS3mg022_3437 [Armatimonadota bacterium]|nr:MAG: hypothetical protein KatS3mg022_3437 [Armatimonadota bacterium]
MRHTSGFWGFSSKWGTVERKTFRIGETVTL